MTLSIVPVHGLPEVRPNDDLVGLLMTVLGSAREKLVNGDVLVVAQKIVSKSEGRLVRLSDVVPGKRALEMAEESGKDARQLEVVLRETKQIIRWERGVLISETHHGFVCANAGVDRSNAGAPDTVVLLPIDPDASAARIRDEVATRARAAVAVVITDTFGRAWREGHTNVAIGIAGLPALKRYVGQRDPEGYELRVTEIAVADEIAAAAELVMGKLDRCPVAIVRGLTFEDSDETAQEYVRPAARDMFRQVPRSELTAAQRKFLEQKRFAVVGTRNADGSPHIAVMWYLLDGDDIVVNSAQGRVKDRNLAADPRMSVLVEDGYRWIRVDGRARIEHDQSITHEDIRRLASRYYEDERKVEEGMRNNFSKQHRITYRLPVLRVAGEGF